MILIHKEEFKNGQYLSPPYTVNSVEVNGRYKVDCIFLRTSRLQDRVDHIGDYLLMNYNQRKLLLPKSLKWIG